VVIFVCVKQSSDVSILFLYNRNSLLFCTYIKSLKSVFRYFSTEKVGVMFLRNVDSFTISTGDCSEFSLLLNGARVLCP